MLWSGMESKILPKLLEHEELLDVEITLWTSERCTVAHFFEKHWLGHRHVSQNKHQEQRITEYASLIRNGFCQCRRCTTGERTKLSSSCLCRIAAAIGEVWLIEFLLDRGCRPHSDSFRYGYTPAFLAMAWSHYDVVKILLQRAAGVLSRPIAETSWTLLHMAVEFITHDTFTFVEMVLNGLACDVNALNGRLETALSTAVRYNGLEIVRLLLDNGADPNIPSQGVIPLLHLAVCCENKEMVFALIRAGADVNVFEQRHSGMTALHTSIDRTSSGCNHAAQIGITRLLLENGADPNLKTNRRETPLSIAVYRGCAYIDTVNLLLANGAEPDTLVNVDNAEDLDAAMHYCAYHGNVEEIKALLDHGANPDILNSSNASPLWYAIYMKHPEIVCLLVMQNVSLSVKGCGHDLLRSYGLASLPLYGKPRSLLWVAVERQWMDGVTILLQAGYNIWKEGWLLSGEDEGLPEESLAISRHLRALAKKPPSLLSSCRQIIRKTDSSDLQKTVQQFPVPKTLKDYLLLKDLKGLCNEMT